MEFGFLPPKVLSLLSTLAEEFKQFPIREIKKTEIVVSCPVKLKEMNLYGSQKQKESKQRKLEEETEDI